VSKVLYLQDTPFYCQSFSTSSHPTDMFHHWKLQTDNVILQIEHQLMAVGQAKILDMYFCGQ